METILAACLAHRERKGYYPPQFAPNYTNGEYEQSPPLHGWRTSLLPYLGREDLYENVDFSKPWDDPVNMRHTNVSLNGYRSPRSVDPPRMTNYVAIAGEGFGFDGYKEIRTSRFRDGTSLTIILIEIVNSTIPWAKPDDISLDELNWETLGASPSSQNLVRKDAVVGYADGTVTTLDGHEKLAWLNARLTIAGGEDIQGPNSQTH